MKAFLEVKELFESAKAQEYLGEDITLVEHMLQCAELAKRENAPSWLLVAALLHDIGHILVPDAKTAQDSGVDLHHDQVGAEWIALRFPANIVAAVKLHVDAKKYLVDTEIGYLDKLSAASKITLTIQGGGFTQEQSAEFINKPFAHEAVQLRRWDDAGKVRGAAISLLEDFEVEINEVAFS